MNHQRSRVRGRVFAFLIAAGIASNISASAQNPTEAQLEDALWNCLKQRIPSVERSIADHTRAYDPESKRNFAWDRDKQAWIDVKTGESICPKTSSEASKEDALWNCLKQRIPTVERSIAEHTKAYDPESKRNFAWDRNKQAWIDVKTGECICPKCPPEPKTSGKIGCFEKQTNLFLGYAYSNAPDAPVKNLHGFNGSVFHNVTGNVALGGEVSGGYGSDHIRIGMADADVKVTRYTYLFGPQFSTCPNDTVRLFGHTLIGGAHDASRTTLGTATTDFSANALAMGFGGGVDVKVNRRVSIRAFQADYVPTRFSGNWQNNFRLSSGVVVRFGRK